MTKHGHSLRRQFGLDDRVDCRPVGPDASFYVEVVVSPIARVRTTYVVTALRGASRPATDCVRHSEAVATSEMHA